jgi:hypothetical protein
LLTNAFKFKSGPQKLTSEVFDVAYKHSFNTCDRLNHFIANKEYPHRRDGWTHSFDDFHFTTLLWNTYVLWHELRKGNERVSWKKFCTQLSHELLEANK